MGSVTYQEGDILYINGVDAICHQVNCLTVKAHGLSANIAMRYPWGDIYSKRIPIGTRNLATIRTRGTPGDVTIFGDGSGFNIVCLKAQWEYGKCFRSFRKPIAPYYDTTDNRERWFQQCLNKLGERIDIQTIAFPEYIGCGLAGGDWKKYLGLIKDFAETFNKKMIIVSYNCI